MNIAEEQQLRHEADRGRRAQDLMSDELMVEAFNTIRTRLTTEWADSPARDHEGREKIWLMLKSLNAVEVHLRTTLETGQMAQTQLNQLRQAMQKVQETVRDLWV